MQNKKQSLVEAVSGTLIIEVSMNQNILITSIFFLASIVRGYFVRRLFNKIFKR